MEIICRAERFYPLQNELFAVALATRTPHRRSFTHIEHAELYGRFIRYYSHLPAHGINLAHNLSFGDTSYGRIATHLTNCIHIHGYEQGATTQSSRSRSSFTTGVTGTYNDNIIFKISHLQILSLLRWGDIYLRCHFHCPLKELL